jgi:carbon-monoxide dehydrogenase medium subunit
MENFHYYKPVHIAEVWQIMEKTGGDCLFLAGGTDLFPEIKSNLKRPRHLIDVKGLSDYHFLNVEDQSIRIGANLSLSEFLENNFSSSPLSFLADAVQQIGSQQIRNRATLIGNICRASPAADSLPPLICLGAKVRVENARGSKYLDLEDFLIGPGKTLLEPGEMVTEVVIPKPSERTKGTFIKLGRVAEDCATINIAVSIELDADSLRCSHARIVFGAVGPTVIRAKRCEKMLEGEKIHESPLEAVADIAVNQCKPIDDVRATADYRKKMVRVLTKRALNSATASFRDA